MKKYKLKKDLPTFKTGEEFILDRNGDLYCPAENIMAYYHETLNKFPNILTDWFEEIPEQPKTVWDLKNGDKFYRVSASGMTGYYWKIWQNNELDNLMRDMGEVFLNEEDAIKELARRKAKVILEQDTKGFKADWKNNNQNKWYVTYQTYFNGQLVAERTQGYNYGPLAFGSWEDAQASIKTHKKEWKIYLGVEE